MGVMQSMHVQDKYLFGSMGHLQFRSIGKCAFLLDADSVGLASAAYTIMLRVEQ
jgi:hypothetical protein